MRGRLKYLLSWSYFTFVSVHLVLFVFLKKEKIDPVLKREKSDFPSFTDDSNPFYQRLEAYLSDHFPGKNAYIAQANLFFDGILGAGNAKNKVLWGNQNWLFYNATLNDEKGINEAFGYKSLSASEVQKISHNLETIKNWCQSHHIYFDVILCPNKHSVYPENLPSPYIFRAQSSQLNQVYAAIPELLNVQKLLMIKKKKGIALYYRQDTHWNNFGAYIAVKAFQERLLQAYPFLQPFEARPILVNDQKEMDLANMMGLNDYFSHQEVGVRFIQQPSKRIPHLMIVHDSFLTSLRPSLDQLFVKVSPKFIFKEGLLSPEILLREKADVFVIELVERYKSALLGDIHPDYYK